MGNLSDSTHGGPRDWALQYGIIAFVCTVTSHRVGCGCTVWSFTAFGECGLSLSLGLCPMRLIVESGNVRGSKCKPRSYVAEMKTQGHGYRPDLELSDRSRG